MRIHGETHFRDIEIEMTEYGPDGSRRGVCPPPGSISGQLRQTGSLIGTLLLGGNTSSTSTRSDKITASDGETRIIGAGAIILIEDVHANGHLSQALGQMSRSVMVPID